MWTRRTSALMWSDVAYAQKESESERQRLSKMQADGGDEYEVRAQEKVIADADQMIPDYRKRLHSAISELAELMKSPDMQAVAPDDLDSANKILEAAQAQL